MVQSIVAELVVVTAITQMQPMTMAKIDQRNHNCAYGDDGDEFDGDDIEHRKTIIFVGA